MADQYTPEEIQAIFDEYNQAIANGIPVTKEMNDRLKDATKGIKDYSANLRASLTQLGTATKALGKDMLDGKKGASVFNDSLSSAADAASNVAMGFGPLGIAVGLAVKAFSFFVTQVNKQSDKLYESFQNISRSGAIGAQGMDQIFESMLKMGYTIDELSSMGDILKENSKNFGLFSSSVLSGTKQFADVANTIQNSDLRSKFFNLGMSVDDINKGIGGYLNQQGRLGALQGKTQDDLRKGAVAYLKEMETLTRLTGQQREELEAQREQAVAVDAFYAAIEDMPNDAREQALATYNILAKQNPEIAKEYAANMGGIITGQTDMFLATGGKSMEIFSKEFYLAGGKAEDAMNNLGSALRENRDTLKGVAQVGGKFGMTLLDADQIMRKDFRKGMNEAADSVTDSMNATNAATDAQSKLRDRQIKQTQALQDLINVGVNPLTRAMQVLSAAIENLIDLIPFSGKARAKVSAEAARGGGGVGPGGAASVKTPLMPGEANLLDKIIQAESQGRNVGTTGSSAFGVAQMTRGTFENLAKKAAPGTALYGKTFEDMKKDVELQKEALAQLTKQNQADLARAKIVTSDAATYLAHFLGSGGAIKVLQAPEDAPIGTVVSPDAIQSNPNVFGKMSTVGDLKAWADRKMGGMGYAVGPNMPTTSPVPDAATEVSGAAGFKETYASINKNIGNLVQGLNLTPRQMDGVMSGPMSGYKPNLLMHGNEEISVRPVGVGSTSENSGASEGSVSRLIDKVDDLIQVSRSQLAINEKILKMQM